MDFGFDKNIIFSAQIEKSPFPLLGSACGNGHLLG
jgi:hypothetical protein